MDEGRPLYPIRQKTSQSPGERNLPRESHHGRSPLAGEKFVSQLLTDITPQRSRFLHRSGYGKFDLLFGPPGEKARTAPKS